jgi:hypothetical protein
MLKVVVHSYFDMFTYKAMGGAVFVLSYAVLLSFFTGGLQSILEPRKYLLLDRATSLRYLYHNYY